MAKERQKIGCKSKECCANGKTGKGDKNMAKTNSGNAPRQRKWLKPTTRAEGYAEERKLGVHMRGDKKDQELDEYNKGLRSGYLLAQSDNAGMYKYKKALSEGKSVPEARKISRQIGKATSKKKNDKGAA